MTQPVPELTEDDYTINLATLLTVIGVDPNTVETGTTRIDFIDGKAILRYGVIRAIPAKTLAIATMHSAGLSTQFATDEPEEQQ